MTKRPKAKARSAGRAASPKKGIRRATQRPPRRPAGLWEAGIECSIAEADSVKSGLLGLVSHPDLVTLDLTALERLDTAGLQLIAAFVSERASSGGPVRIQGAPEVFRSAAGLLGLTSLLEVVAT